MPAGKDFDNGVGCKWRWGELLGGLAPSVVGLRGSRQLGLDALEQVCQRGADREHDRDNGDRDAGGDQAVLDGRGAGLVLDEAGN